MNPNRKWIVDFWDTDNPGTSGPSLTSGMISRAESALGYKLPDSYVQLIRTRNGGRARRRCFPTSVPTSWARDHIQIESILGIGYDWGIDGEFGSRYMIPEWGCPEIGILIADTPSGGHDWVMLDYSQCGPQGEPRVIHVETECDEPILTRLAPDFETFIRGLRDESEFPIEP